MSDVTDKPEAITGQPIINNSYGSVYDDRIGFYAKKGWFSGGVLEELPMRHITSVRLEHSRNIIGGIVLIIIGAVCFLFHGVGIFVGLIFIGLAILMIMGSPLVCVNTAGGDLRPAKGAPWTKGDAEAFVAAVRTALFAR